MCNLSLPVLQRLGHHTEDVLVGGATREAFDKVLLMGERCDVSPMVLRCPDFSVL